VNRILLSVVAIGMLTGARAPAATALDYGFTATIKDGQLSVQHRILNRSQRALCFFPDSMDIARARLRGVHGKEIENIYNSGYVIGRQIVYFVAPDGKTHQFSYSAELSEVFRPVEETEKIGSLEYDFFGLTATTLHRVEHESCQSYAKTRRPRSPRLALNSESAWHSPRRQLRPSAMTRLPTPPPR
jgi:hypothetical protein